MLAHLRLILISTGVAVLLGMGFWYVTVFGVRSAATPLPQAEEAMIPHAADSGMQSLKKIEVQAVYFVPRDRGQYRWAEWPQAAQGAFEELSAFHAMQFNARSTLSFTVVREPLIGEHEGIFYDGVDTSGGNPNAWQAIHEEIDRTLGSFTSDTETFRIHLILYEGAGAIGGEDAVLVSSAYLRNVEERYRGASVIYHEFGHTFGLPDAYDHAADIASSEDIMGFGRTRPITRAFLSEGSKQALGIR